MIFNINSTRGQTRFLTCVARVTCLVYYKYVNCCFAKGNSRCGETGLSCILLINSRIAVSYGIVAFETLGYDHWCQFNIRRHGLCTCNKSIELESTHCIRSVRIVMGFT